MTFRSLNPHMIITSIIWCSSIRVKRWRAHLKIILTHLIMIFFSEPFIEVVIVNIRNLQLVSLPNVSVVWRSLVGQDVLLCFIVFHGVQLVRVKNVLVGECWEAEGQNERELTTHHQHGRQASGGSRISQAFIERGREDLERRTSSQYSHVSCKYQLLYL